MIGLIMKKLIMIYNSCNSIRIICNEFIDQLLGIKFFFYPGCPEQTNIFAQKYLNYDWNWSVYQKISKKLPKFGNQGQSWLFSVMTCEIVHTDIFRTQSSIRWRKMLVIAKEKRFFHVQQRNLLLFKVVNYFLFTLCDVFQLRKGDTGLKKGIE